MRLKASTDFGLRALMRLASDPEQAVSTADMARDLAISRHHLTKVIQTLAARGIVVTRRGFGGGFALARDANQIGLGEIVRLMEADQPLVECFRSDGGACTLTADCLLKNRLASARDAFFAQLDNTTLADLRLSAN